LGTGVEVICEVEQATGSRVGTKDGVSIWFPVMLRSLLLGSSRVNGAGRVGVDVCD
jgi:hypothetical protein